MNLNNPIKWCDATWNPITGCENDCEWCYARKLAEGRLYGRFGYENGFAPTFHEDRLQEPSKRKKPTRIFVSSMGEFFGDWVEPEWQRQVMSVVFANPQHTFQFLTKCPQNFDQFFDNCYTALRTIPSNMWLGVSVTSEDDMWRTDYLREIKGGKRFISFEPLLRRVHTIDFRKIDWIIVGAQTGNDKNKVAPRFIDIEWLTITAEQSDIPVYHKDNLLPHVPDSYVLRKNFPIIGGV